VTKSGDWRGFFHAPSCSAAVCRERTLPTKQTNARRRALTSSTRLERTNHTARRTAFLTIQMANRMSKPKTIPSGSRYNIRSRALKLRPPRLIDMRARRSNLFAGMLFYHNFLSIHNINTIWKFQR